jgi:hypothetical protein
MFRIFSKMDSIVWLTRLLAEQSITLPIKLVFEPTRLATFCRKDFSFECVEKLAAK